jgi:hypothetical protein
MRRASLTQAALVVCIAASTAHAQPSSTPPRAGMPPEAPPTSGTLEVHKANGAYYVSGGVSEAERKRLETTAKYYNLRVDLAQSDGAYLPGVNVGVQDGQGNWLVKARSEGPIFYAQIPAGAYKVEATARDGRKVSMSTFVPRNGQRALEIRFQAQGQ